MLLGKWSKYIRSNKIEMALVCCLHTIWPQHVLLYTTPTSGQVTRTCDHRQKGRESCSLNSGSRSQAIVTLLCGIFEDRPKAFGQCLQQLGRHLVSQSHLQPITPCTLVYVNALPQHSLNDCCVTACARKHHFKVSSFEYNT